MQLNRRWQINTSRHSGRFVGTMCRQCNIGPVPLLILMTEPIN